MTDKLKDELEEQDQEEQEEDAKEEIKQEGEYKIEDSSKNNYSRVRQIPLLPLRDILVFPTTVVPLFVGREKSIQALEHAMATDKEILLVAQMKAKVSDPTDEDIYKVGTISSIRQLLKLPDGTVKVLVEGKKRAKIVKYIEKSGKNC